MRGKDFVKEKFKDDPEKLKYALWDINHRYYIKHKDRIIAAQREYRKKKRQLLAIKSV